MGSAAGEFLLHVLPEKAGVSDQSPTGSEELHVLAVDDSLVDRKVIERLLKISSCKGAFVWVFFFFFIVDFLLELGGFENFFLLSFFFFPEIDGNGIFSDGCGEWDEGSAVSGVGRWGELGGI